MTDRKQFRTLTDPDAAADAVASLPIDPDIEQRPLLDARDAVLADRIDAPLDVPGFDRSALDGYAVQAADTFGADEVDPVTLSVVGAVHAGDRPTVHVDSGEAVEIATGAMMPPGADAMVPIERIREHAETIEVQTGVAPGDNVSFAGADIAAGQRVLGPGTRLTSRDIAVLSALGHDTVPVHAPPTVGIVSTGDELVRPGESVDHEQGQIYDVNSYSIATAVADAGGVPTVYPHVVDDREAIETTLIKAATECDLVLSSGSTSASAADIVYQVVEDHGTIDIHGIGLKPGKPTVIGTIDDTGYVGLPGYPVSAAMVFRTLVAPTLRDVAGRPQTPPGLTYDATMAVEERFSEGRRRLLPVGLVADGDSWIAYPVDRGSGATTSLAVADGLVTVPADVSYLDAGESVTVDLFSQSIQPPEVLVIGEADPVVADALDQLSRPRYLQVGTRVGLRRLRAGIPDVVIAAGPSAPTVDTVELAKWSHPWGLLVPSGNPDAVSGITDLIDRDLTFVNRVDTAGLREALDDRLAEIATARESSRSTLTDHINGWGHTTRGIDSPGQLVGDGQAAAGLGIAPTAQRLDLDFVPLGDLPVRALGAVDRVEKSGVTALTQALADRRD